MAAINIVKNQLEAIQPGFLIWYCLKGYERSALMATRGRHTMKPHHEFSNFPRTRATDFALAQC
jgi:hypothetical protein